MPGAGAHRVSGLIERVWPNGTYEARLPNGHRLRAFVPGRARLRARRLAPGDTVVLEVSPADLSRGRIVMET